MLFSLAAASCQAVLGLDSLSEQKGHLVDATTAAAESGPAGDDGSATEGSTMPAEGGGDESIPVDDGGRPDVIVPPVPSSCSGGGSGAGDSCGPQGNADCCASTTVSGVTYDRTYGNGPGSDATAVSDFRLDAFEVTVGRFRAYVSQLVALTTGSPTPGSGKHTHLNGGAGLSSAEAPGTFETGWDASWDDVLISGGDASEEFAESDTCNTTYTASVISADRESVPMNCVSWYDAYAFCIWDGGFLPSEAEWELAAAGGTDQRLFPWGSTAPDSSYATFDCDAGSLSCLTSVGVTTFGEGKYGQYDLSGNVAEWTLDSAGAYVDCDDCANVDANAADKIDRGGAFQNTLDQVYLYPQGRGQKPPTMPQDFVGIRCARVP